MMNLRFLGYHGTLIGLNYWPKVIMLGMITMVIVGLLSYYRTGGNEIKKRYDEPVFTLVSGIFSLALYAALYAEAWEGISLILEEQATTATAGAIMPAVTLVFIMPLICLLAGAALYGLGSAVAYATKSRYQIMNATVAR